MITRIAIFTLLATIFYSFNINAQAVEGNYPKDEIQKAKEAGEILLFDKKRIELGPVNKGDQKDMTFRFLNISDQVIEYSFFDVCSCSKLTYEEDAKIKPGEEGVFYITFDSGAREEIEPVEVNFELKNIDKRTSYPYFYTVDYTFSFK